jgi:predicted transcriptional regulator
VKVLLSIKPEYVAKIFSGEKKYEYRKSLFSRVGITTVVIYATMPVGKVVGEFKIERILSDTPKEIWKQTQSSSGINQSFYDQYFDGKDKAFAIKIADFKVYDKPQSISQITQRTHPPQSFCYV